MAAFAIQADGALTPLNHAPSGGTGACHIWTDATGRDVLVANYGSGTIACIQTNADGSLSRQTAQVRFSGSGPDPIRQQKPFAHSIYTDPSNRFVYSCDLGTDNVWIFHFDAKNGTLTPAEPPCAKVPPGSGPRHLAFHPNGRFAYSINELGMSVTAFTRDTESGALLPGATVSDLEPNTPRQGATAAEIFCHPSGKWLYSTNRGPDNIAVFSIGEDGKLALLNDVPALVKVPRSFAIDPSGRWLIAAGQQDNKVAVFAIDPHTGRPTETSQSASAPSPVCVLFAPGVAR